MAIYKLGDILDGKPIYGAGLKARKKGKYKYFRQTDINGKPSMFVNESQGKIMKKDDFFISRSGTIDSYLHKNNEKYVYAGYIIKYPINKNLAITKYIYYWSKGIGNKQIRAFSNTGSTMPKFNPPVAMQLKINLPNLKVQQQIIDIIEPNEKLFLSYPNCVRIDTHDNAKNDMKLLIDIIEPLEKLLTQITLFEKLIINLLEKMYKISKKKIVKIKDIAKVFIGTTPSTKDKKNWSNENNGKPWINSGLLTNSFVVKKPKKYLSNISYIKVKKAKPNELLFSIIDPSKKKLSIANKELAFNQSIALIKSNKNLFFEIREIMWFFNKIKSGSAQQSINKNDIENTYIYLSKTNYNKYFDFLILLEDFKQKTLLVKSKIINLLII